MVASLEETEFVVVRTSECEGFFKDGVERTPGLGNSTTVAGSQTVRAFVERNDIGTRWDDHDWFLRLLGSVRKTALAPRLRDISPTVHSLFVQNLARIWYDFDSLAAGRARRFTDTARLKRVLHLLTRKVLEATDRFVRDAEARMAAANAEDAANAKAESEAGDSEAVAKGKGKAKATAAAGAGSGDGSGGGSDDSDEAPALEPAPAAGEVQLHGRRRKGAPGSSGGGAGGGAAARATGALEVAYRRALAELRL